VTRADIVDRIKVELDAWAGNIEATIPDLLAIADVLDTAIDECFTILDEQREQDRTERDREQG